MVPGEGQSFHECVVRVSLVAKELVEPIKTYFPAVLEITNTK